MTQRVFLTVGCALIFGLFILMGAGTPITRVQLWLAGLDSRESARATALSPLIKCVNQYDVHWRLGYYNYRTQGVWRVGFADMLNNARDFANSSSDIEQLSTQACGTRMLNGLRQLRPNAPLIGLGETYLEALRQANATRRAYAPPVRGDYTAAANPADVARAQPVFDRYLQASADLREALAVADISGRRAQQRLLEKRLGQDIHWHLLGYMIQARSSVDQLSQGLRQNTLNPALLAQANADLQQAWDAGQPLRNRTQPNRPDTALYLWSAITPSAQSYHLALQTLLQDWQAHATPQRLSEDYHAVVRAYDSLLSFYNKPAQMDY